MLIILITMTVFEITKQAIWPNITIWQSHFMTIIFTTLVAGTAIYVSIRQYETLRQQTLEEKTLRQQTEVAWQKLAEKTALLEEAKQKLEQEIIEREQAEEALRESERKFRSLVENSADGITLVDDQGIIIEWNRSQEEIMGLKRAEAVGRPIWDVQFQIGLAEERKTAGIYEQVKAITVDFLKTGQAPWLNQLLERDIERPDGMRRTIQTLVFPIKTGESFMIGSTARDITERKQAEEALRKSEEKFSKLFRASPAAIAIAALEDGRLEDVNEAFLQIFGYDREEVIGRTAADLSTWAEPRDRDKFVDLLKREGSFRGLEARHRIKSGEIRSVLLSAELIEIEAEPYIIWELTDITERKQAEKILRESEERFRTVADFTYDWEYWLGSDGNYLYVSPSCHRITGYHPDEFLHDPELLEKIIHPEDRKMIFAGHSRDEFESDQAISLDFRIITRSGSERWINHICLPVYNAEGRYLGRRASNRDITDRKQAEQALRDSEKRYRLLAEHATDMISRHDPEGTYLYVSPACRELLGYEPDEMVGCRVYEFFHPKDLDVIRQSHPNILEACLASTLSYRIRPKKGPYVWVETTSRAVRNPDTGQLKEIVAITRNITNRKRASEKLQHYAERLRAMHEIDQAILTAQSPEATAQAALKYIRRLIPCLRASVSEFDLNADKIRLLAVDANGETSLGAGKELPIDAFGDIKTLKQGNIHLVQAISALSRLSSTDRTLYKEGINAYVCVPLIAQDKLIGSLNLGAASSEIFTDDHIAVARNVATSLAVAIQQARLYEQAIQDAQTKLALLHEVNHRVKNNLAAIIGLLYIEQNHTQEENPLIEDLINRVEGLATAHHMLSAAEWSSLPLSDLTNQIIHSALQILPPAKQISIKVSPSTIHVNPKEANSLAMVINELTTNTIKYALDEQKMAQITVRLEQENDTVMFEFRDDGPGYPENVLRLERYNVGLHLIQNIIQKDLRGTVTLHNDHGAVTTLCFKIAEGIG
jgi:PAS domain S-box-containing protein